MENGILRPFCDLLTVNRSILTFDGWRRKKKGCRDGSPERKSLFQALALGWRPSKQSIAIAVLDQMVQCAAAAADQGSGRRAPSATGCRADTGSDGRRSGYRQNGFQLGIATASYGRARRTVNHFLSGCASCRLRDALFGSRLKTIGISILEPVVIASAGGIVDAG
jgi:hypothetical protein